MEPEDISEIPATISTYTAEALLFEILENEDWVQYTAENNDNVRRLIKRFVGAHSQVPGALSDYQYSSEPLEIFRLIFDDVVQEGALYMNGSFIITRKKDGSAISYSLFMDKTTQRIWRYPPDAFDVDKRAEKFRELAAKRREDTTHDADQ